MIRRRLVEHIRAQNWAAVGLDFVVVVVGILIAFQITEWNTARREGQTEQRYLLELARDLEADVEEVKRGQGQTLSRLAMSEGILLEIDSSYERPGYFPELSSDPAADLQVAGYAYAALTSTFFVIGTDYTFNELVQSGTLGVLSNRALVNELTVYYGSFKQRREQDRIAFDQIGPMMSYFRENGLGLGDRATIEDAVRLAERDEHFLGLVKTAHFLSLWQYASLQPILADAEAALASVHAEIEARR